MKLVCLSDVHEHFDVVVPDGDVLIIAGDLCERSNASFVKAESWVKSLAKRFKYIVYVPGNHDQPILERPSEYRGIAPTLLGSMVVDATMEIDGIRIYGMPYESHGRENPEEVIPEGVDVLVTHEPPWGVRDWAPQNRDTHIGNAALLRAVERQRPRVHIFGHAHFGHGLLYDNGTLYANVAICGRPGKYYGLAHAPTVLNIFPDGVVTW
jgi:Icc-related predicted phosphoesterase